MRREVDRVRGGNHDAEFLWQAGALQDDRPVARLDRGVNQPEQLERDAPPELGVRRQVDLGHAPGAERPEDLVAPQSKTGSEGHRPR